MLTKEKQQNNKNALTFSFSMARAAMLASLKLTKAQNLSCSTRILSISPYLQYKETQADQSTTAVLT